ncbi:ABC transporter substrate-binding protein [Aureimonas flava]|uniref:ABC transporter substrate-binding protein n=1 Tax=Aureimonas flava TaxID=2320271 RepID=A0A3A1WHC0_9HYPH|nr:ABC transporter substrate-binding protein [Aureimonas flava]RIX98223.1 ABC transporter substrate-binding protein [Aureimonas flava]
MNWKTVTYAVAAMALLGEPALAADTVKLAVGQRGNWDTSVAEIGNQAGIFQKHDLDLDLLYTQGGGETMQAVISGSVDIGVAAGTLGVLGAFSKGAPVRIIGAQATGAADFWYVPSASKLQSIKDATPDTTIAYSTNGSSTNSMALGFVDTYGLKSKLVATGSPSATFTPVMTGQIDVGWSSPPFGFDALDEGKIRIVARANDIDAIKNQSIRSLIANAPFVDQKQDILDRFMQAYRETEDFMYSSDDALKIYADFAKIDVATAKRIRDEFFPKSLIDPDKMSGMDQVMADAVKFKAISGPLSDAQLTQLIQIPPRR